MSIKNSAGRDPVDLETLNLDLSPNKPLDRGGGSAFRNSNVPGGA